jgi:hypothetical protein
LQLTRERVIVGDNKYIELGASEDLPTNSTLNIAGWNVVLVHRHPEWILQKWGNYCSRIVTKIVIRADNEKPIRWYHKFIYDFCYDQYDRFGDYYRILDNSFGEADDDDIYEVR